jgi:uncharacterized membrane protein YhaH (DUF805 family)
MNLSQAIVSGFKNYSSIEGRAARSEYWNWTLFCVLGGLITSVLDGAIFHRAYSGGPYFSYPLNVLFNLVTFVPSIAVGIRRLHDVNRKGTWMFLIFTVIGCIPLFIWDCMQGTEGDNRFGGDPLAGAAAIEKP